MVVSRCRGTGPPSFGIVLGTLFLLAADLRRHPTSYAFTTARASAALVPPPRTRDGHTRNIYIPIIRMFPSPAALSQPPATRDGHFDARVNRRWLQDTSKRKLADFLIFLAPPAFPFPRVNPRLTRRWIKTGAPDKNHRVD